MFYTPKGFVFENKVQKPLKEGGSAAETLITAKLDPDGSKGLKFSKISKEKLRDLFGKISQLLNTLKKEGLIEDAEPSYQLGSTRLARYSLTNDSSLLRPGEEEILDTALEKKTSFGDLDIDVEFKKDTNDLFKFIDSLENFAALKGNNQIHLAFVDGTNVYQVDLVNVKDKKELYSFKEKSSFIDLAKGIKGAFSIILLRALASTKSAKGTDRAIEEVYNDQVKIAEKGGEDAENAQKIVNAARLNRVPTKIRYSLGDKGLVFLLVLEDDPSNPPEKPRKPKELKLSGPPKYNYENLDELAQYLLDDESATGNDIYHAVLLADKIKNLPNKQEVWEYFLGSAEMNLKKGISEEDYNTGIEELKKIIFPKNNSSTISEGRKGIGRFVGSSKFSGVKAFSVLKDIAKNSTLENNKLIINFNDNIFLVEKMDSSFCHFGIDPKGQFFFEIKSSGPVYSDTADEKLGFKIDFIKTFKDLEKNENFQKSLQTIFNKFGSFKFSAELFPVLTHEGTKDEQIIFVGVPYSRNKFGEKGGFVIFNVNLLNDQGSYQTPDYKLDNEITSEFKRLSQEDGWDNQWKVYTNNQDMKKPSEDLEIELEPELFQALKNNSEYSRKLPKELQRPVMKAGEQIQTFLDTKANEFSSNLSSKEDNSYIEGLVLKVIDEKGNITEVKGTSSSFNEKVKVYWQDRDAIANLKKNFKKELLKNVLKFETTTPDKLKGEIEKLGQDFNPEEVKSRATKVIENITKEYSKLLKDFKTNQENLDQDSIRKTNDHFDSFKKEFFDPIKNFINKDLNKNNLFDFVKLITGSKIDNKENNRKNAIIWVGRAQPWHFGHHAMIEKGISNLKNPDNDKVLIFLVKGSGGPTKENPLTLDQQLNLLNSIYADNKNVEIAQKPLDSAFTKNIVDALHDLNYNLTGWLAGPDRIEGYKKNLKKFDPNIYKKDHNFSPISKNDEGLLNLTFIPTGREFSGTKSRNIALEKPFEEWLSEITQGMNLSDKAKQSYKIAYDQIRDVNNVPDESNLEQPGPPAEQSAPPFSSESSLDEMSAMGAFGAVAGYAGPIGEEDENRTIYREMQENYFIKREDLMEELRLREAIRKIITENKKKELNEEQRLRKVIRRMLTEGKKADEVIYQSTGVNALRDLLANVGSIIKDKYRNLATSAKQREAFKNHLLIGWRNLLNIADISKGVEDKKAPKSLDDIELEEDIEIKIKKQDPSSMLADFEPKEYEPLKSKEQKLVAGGELPTDPDQKTGMNAAAECLNLISSQTLTSYEQLFNPQDAEDFKEYGLANIAAYLDEIEAEMTVAPEIDIETPEGSVEVEEPAVVEDQLDLSESLLHKLANLL